MTPSYYFCTLDIYLGLQKLIFLKCLIQYCTVQKNECAPNLFLGSWFYMRFFFRYREYFVLETLNNFCQSSFSQSCSHLHILQNANLYRMCASRFSRQSPPHPYSATTKSRNASCTHLSFEEN